ncbi:MAG TPA: ABC transporter permease [Candidatus Limnocylindria bacterium]|jgi:ABC-2 type transport system permease protein|nr:ABC transporter permease [Candidatus Limnocylindria bacterium]
MTSLVRPALLIAINDLRRRLRDRSALVIAFVAPLTIASIISFALGGTGRFHATFAVADEDGGEIARSFVNDVLGAPAIRDIVTVNSVASADDARSATAAGKASAGIVIPAGFTEAVRAGRPVEIGILKSVDSPVSGEVAQSLASQFATDLAAARQARATGTAPVRGRLVDGAVGVREVRAASYFGPSMAIFFLFFVVEFGAIAILAERRSGTLARLLAAPISRESVVVGKALYTFTLGALSLTTMALATTFLLGASWGDPLAVAALIAAIVLAAMGITALTATFAGSEQRASAFSSMITMGLAMLGGNFIPIAQAPELMRSIALLTPNGLALRGFTDLVADGGGLVSVLPYIAGILAFALVTGSLAVWRSRDLVVA